MKTLLIIMMLISTQAHAIGPDKVGHFKAGLVIGFTVSLGTKHPKWGFATGCGVGLAKEIRDAQGFGHPEFADFAYTCAGAGIASWAVGKIIK